jgi:formamidopyrimidine-DNA glycosylase
VPELPEVETLRRGFERTLIGRRIDAIDIRLPKMVVAPTGLKPSSILGQIVERVERRAKMLVLRLSGDVSMIIHLKLSGQLVLLADGKVEFAGGHPVPYFGAPLPHKATHVIFTLDSGRQLVLTDIRQFGSVVILPTSEVEAVLASKGLGPEPLDPQLSLDDFVARLGRYRSAPLKQILLDQSFVAGLGNIYADEVLFLSRIHPARNAGSLDEADRARLFSAVRAVLTTAIDEGVAEIVNGKALETRQFPRAHGRAGRPCFTCATPIERVKMVGRSTYFCPTCQPPVTPPSV